MKKLMAIIMASFMTLGLTACGGAGADADMYIATNVTMMGITMSPEEISEGGITLALDENGKATLTLDGEEYNCKWTTEEEVFTLSQGSDEFTGTKDGDVVTIVNMLDSGMDINFLKEGATPPVDESKPTGKFMLSEMEVAGEVISCSDIQMEEMIIILNFKEDGSTEFSADGENIMIPIDFEEKTMELDGGIWDYTFEDEQFIITTITEGMEMSMRFTAEGSAKWEEYGVDASEIAELFATRCGSSEGDLLNVVIEPMEENDEIDNQLVEVIKVIREYTDIPLIDAKNLVQDGGVVKSVTTPEEAEEMKVRLEELGIVVKVE